MHFTFQNFVPDADLQQGDVLDRTPELEQIISAIHPYYSRANYRHFAVLTQSCDLVRGRKSDRYITLGAVRPLSDAIDREVAKYQSNYVLKRGNLVPESVREKVRQFVERLLNNNEPEYFYLHEDASVGLGSASCIYLRLSIALHPDNYEACRAARIVSLNQTFQAKLGWLVGNIYSRVGTDDWVPKTASTSEFKARIKDILERNVAFMSDKKVDAILKTSTEDALDALDYLQVRKLVDAAPEPKRKADVIKVILAQVENDGLVTGPDLAKLQRRLENNSAFASFFR